jgi:hypothetical protein
MSRYPRGNAIRCHAAISRDTREVGLSKGWTGSRDSNGEANRCRPRGKTGELFDLITTGHMRKLNLQYVPLNFQKGPEKHYSGGIFAATRIVPKMTWHQGWEWVWLILLGILSDYYCR